MHGTILGVKKKKGKKIENNILSRGEKIRNYNSAKKNIRFMSVCYNGLLYIIS